MNSEIKRNNMEAFFYKKITKSIDNKIVFLYEIEGTVEELRKYKDDLGKNYRTSDNGKPLYFTSWYGGERRPFGWVERSYKIEDKEIAFLSATFFAAGHDLWRILDHACSSDLRFSRERKWSLNRGFKEGNNTKIYKVPHTLKMKLIDVAKDYKIPIREHTFISEKEAQEKINEKEEQEAIMNQIAFEEYESNANIEEINKDGLDSMDDDSDGLWRWNID